MTVLIIALVLPATLALLSLAPTTRLERRMDTATDEDLASIRQGNESPVHLWFLIGWGATTLFGAVFLLVRGQSIGYAWLGVAALWAVAAVTTRRHRQRVLAVLGERGRVERTARYRDRAALSYRWGSAALLGYVGQRFVQYAYPGQRPDGASLAVGIFAVVFLAGIVGFAVVRTRMYLSGDDLDVPDVRS
ncbi:hypothetical protein AERO_09815 [Aeromicrobium fastidiosum]|uniref:hypothetical protein n=1 Tax=Aeromicrobium fastidiosum TaxID=52699 RepID=UPI002023762D|nr:hypothetical protein [Aeromicrobium fastidiosum]MCL8251678.1 hypothetical protein [Aeromicrobium fastidiosum]